jgi:two-component system, OmpR family, KDP operon response regulator KdpE
VTKVLVVDDEPQILRALRINLQARAYDVVTAGSGRAALQAAHDSRPDLVVLDLGLPDVDGVEVVRSLRAWTTVPILILSGRLNSRAKVEALDAGADDYVTKPFNVDELLARVRAVSRRVGEPETPAPVRIGAWEVDLEAHTVRRAPAGDDAGTDDGDTDEPGPATGAPPDQLHLTPTEWQLLEALVRQPGRLVGQRQLLLEVWGPTYTDQTHYLRQYIKALRRKLETDPARPRHLLTEAGMGYRFQP